MIRIIILCFLAVIGLTDLSAQHNHDHDHDHDHSHHAGDSHGHGDDIHNGEHGGHDEHQDAGHSDHGVCHCPGEGDNTHNFDAGATAIHHISDQNIYTIGPFHLPLPVFAFAPGKTGLSVFSSGYFEADSHGNSCKAKDRYVIVDGMIRRVIDDAFPTGEVITGGIKHDLVVHEHENEATGEIERDEHLEVFVCYNGKDYLTEARSTGDAGLFGGGITGFYDFSLTKNVVSMLLIFALLAFIFFRVAKAYKTREGKAPTGLQNLMETMFLFIQEEVAKPFLGHHYMKYLPLLMSIFFFILGLNLFGQIPFLGGSNVTGNLAVTAALAIIAFLVVNFSGNGHYWKHLLLAPGTPWFVKPILIPVEILGIFIKPFTLMLRLFANITAGHMVIIIFISFIFIFGKSGESIGGAAGGAVGSTLLTLFMMTIELIVAFVQAFVFTILTASYIGAAIEEEHH